MTDTALTQMADATAAHAWAIPQLTDREKVFLQLTADVCQPTLGTPFAEHVRTALATGVTTAEIRALIRLISYDTGYPAALAAIDRLTEIETRTETGPSIVEEMDPDLLHPGPSPLPAPVRDMIGEMDPHFAEYFDLQSRMRTDKPMATLTERERAFATMSIDIHYRTLGETFRIHVDRALRAGATPDNVRAVLRFIAQFGATRAWEAWRALNAFLT
ncbi:MAG TPA: carboxymuconolactone decarboxylase family protein [Pseudonocardiaceae bacterium]|jgi:alkylhydroperoxidase/carboxymuconolactone decarboxylase family protein YurZ|nr:carboxymuconolactone decarboxylase family protein [Pseudonocardiaceae bacterium]